MNKISKQAGETKKSIPKPPFFVLEKPLVKEKDRQKLRDNFNPTVLGELYAMANEPQYLYWDAAKHKISSKQSMYSPDAVWDFISDIRNISSIQTPVRTEKKDYFKWLQLRSAEESLHNIDMFAGGRLFNKTDLLSAESRHSYLSRGVIEEAIASSQLEGAHTTRKAAKEMLVQGRKPRNESEQMILNNYNAINAINDVHRENKMSMEMIFELHSVLTDGTLPKAEQNRFRKDKDDIVVQGDIGNETYVTHIPPKEDFVKDEMERLVAYANDELLDEFIHPVSKAIFLHFWIGYLHPFTDGNGRLARAIFYWYLLRKDYWTFMYVPISTVIKQAPKQYAMAYIYTEQDRNDLTYFYDFHLKKILQAIQEFSLYLDEKLQENKVIDIALEKKYSLNDRQKQLIYYLITDSDPSVTTTSHSTLHDVSRQTAAKDLKELEQMDFLRSTREGRYIRYYPTDKLLKEARIV